MAQKPVLRVEVGARAVSVERGGMGACTHRGGAFPIAAAVCVLCAVCCVSPLKCPRPTLKLRVGLGQNGQILFISVEQLFLNVAGDSAKTLSVLGNMGGVLDGFRLRFVQMWRRPPQNTPDFGVQRIFRDGGRAHDAARISPFQRLR